MGVPIDEVRAAVALARLHGDGNGLAWSPAEWARIWVRLTKRQQRVVYLHVLVGLTITDAADQLGIGRGAADGAWRRALRNIRDALPGDN